VPTGEDEFVELDEAGNPRRKSGGRRRPAGAAPAGRAKKAAAPVDAAPVEAAPVEAAPEATPSADAAVSE
jgi:hypothetical protein